MHHTYMYCNLYVKMSSSVIIILLPPLTYTVGVVWLPGTQGVTGDHTGVPCRGITSTTGEGDHGAGGKASRDSGERTRRHVAGNG